MWPSTSGSSSQSRLQTRVADQVASANGQTGLMRRTARVLLASSLAVVAFAACGDTQPIPTHASQTAPTTYDTSPSAQALEELAEYCTALVDSADPYFGTHQRAKFIDDVRSAGDGPSPAYALARLALAQDHLRFGEVGQAVTVLKEALDRHATGGPH